MQSYFIADRKVTDLTMIVTVGGNPTVQQTRAINRPFNGFMERNSSGDWFPLSITKLKLPTVSDKKLNGIIRRQTNSQVVRSQSFCQKSTQFILRNIGAEISFSTAKEVLGNPTRKGKLLVWPEASFEQQVVMAAIDQCHDRCNGAIYNGVITIGHKEIQIKDYLK